MNGQWICALVTNDNKSYINIFGSLNEEPTLLPSKKHFRSVQSSVVVCCSVSRDISLQSLLCSKKHMKHFQENSMAKKPDSFLYLPDFSTQQVG